MDTIGQSHHKFRLRELVAHGQNLLRNSILNKHKHTNKVGMMIMIYPHGVSHSSKLLNILKVLSKFVKDKCDQKIIFYKIQTLFIAS